MKDVPGVEVLHSLLDNVFVAWPYKHPFALDNLAPLFDDDKICVFQKVQIVPTYSNVWATNTT